MAMPYDLSTQPNKVYMIGISEGLVGKHRAYGRTMSSRASEALNFHRARLTEENANDLPGITIRFNGVLVYSFILAIVQAQAYHLKFFSPKP